MSAKKGPFRGTVPEGYTWEFNDLFQLSDSEQADINLKQAQADAV